MRIFNFKFLVFFLIQFGLFLILWNLQQPRPNHFFGSHSIKQQRLEQYQNQKKIIFSAGSSLSFGLNSKKVEQAFPEYKVINMGIMGTINMRFLLNEIMPYVQQGDLVILPLEYEYYTRDQPDEYLFTLLEVRPSSIQYLDFPLIKSMLNIAHVYLGSAMRHGKRALQGKSYTLDIPPYSKDSFNEYGDIVAHRDGSFKKKITPYEQLTIDDDIHQYSIETLLDYQNSFRQKGVSMVLAYPPIESESYHNCLDNIFSIHKENINAGLTVLGKPDDSRFPTDHFLDSIYHLNGKGVEENTDRFIDSIESFFHEN